MNISAVFSRFVNLRAATDMLRQSIIDLFRFTTAGQLTFFILFCFFKEMSNLCFLFKKHHFQCGSSHGRDEIVRLVECNEDISYHLKSCHLSRCTLKEFELILQRAGQDRISLDDQKKLQICPRHRHCLGKYWRPLRSCQYPKHSGPKTAVKGQEVIGVAMAQQIYELMGTNVPVGSRKYQGIFIFIFIY